ncbi:MAG: hypothetical protein JXQ93_01480 [Flavobacteriaceae bacterium]
MTKTERKITIIGISIMLAMVIIPPFVFSDNDSNSLAPTYFNSCEELNDFIRGKNYYSLSQMWGKGKVYEPYDVSAVGELRMKVRVKWKNILCNNKPVEIFFKNQWYELSDLKDKNPTISYPVNCSSYR